MSAKAIREYDGKRIISRWLTAYSQGKHSYEDRVLEVYYISIIYLFIIFIINITI